MRISIIACIFLSVAFTGSGQTPVAHSAGSVVLGANATDSQIKAGLKEVLSLAVADAVQKIGAENGPSGNGIVKVRLPDKLYSSEKGLRMMGQGLNIEEFELSMNRIAEAAVPAAGELLSKSIADKTFSDARAVLNGESAAATEDLKRSAFPALVKAFKPTVASFMSKTNVQQEFNTLATQYTGLTLGDKCELDVAEYLAANILAGVFSVTGQEEVNIRSNPQSQSELLRKVFSLP